MDLREVAEEMAYRWLARENEIGQGGPYFTDDELRDRAAEAVEAMLAGTDAVDGWDDPGVEEEEDGPGPGEYEEFPLPPPVTWAERISDHRRRP